MIRRLGLAAAALILMASPLLAEDDAFVFRQVKFGMSLEEVLMSEWRQDKIFEPNVYWDEIEGLTIDYPVPPGVGRYNERCRLEYFFTVTDYPQPVTSLSKIVVPIGGPISESQAEIYSEYLGLNILPCENFKTCRNMIGHALTQKYGPPSYDNYPAKLDTGWEKPGLFLFIWGTTPDMPETQDWTGPGAMSGDVIILEYRQKKTTQ